MANEARKTRGKRGAAAPAQTPAEPTPAPQPEPAANAGGSNPRPYVVYRELTLGDLIGEAELGAYAAKVGLTRETNVLIELGTAESSTPKNARRIVAKDKLDEAELRTEAGVPLRAITKSAAEAGRGVARLKVEPTWDD